MDRSGPARKKDRGKQPAVLNKLIAIDSEPPGLCGVDFVRIPHGCGEIQLVIVTSSQSVGFLQTKLQSTGNPGQNSNGETRLKIRQRTL
jgi:hypothetical protein